MRWAIEGADATTGRDVRVEVEADDERAAQLEAKRRRILVSSIVASDPELTPSPEQLMADLPVAEQMKIDLQEMVMRSTGPRRPAPTSVPSYESMAAGASLLGLIAVIFLVLTVVCLVVGAAFLIEGNHAAGADLLWRAPLLLGGAVLLRALASTILAIRDIARNSFHR